MKFEQGTFFAGVRKFLASQDKTLTQARTNALKFLILSFENDRTWKDVRHIAYAFATICAETAWTFEPIQEYGSYAYFEKRYGYKTAKGRELGNDAAGEGAKYSGKGFVQLTGETNYEKLETALLRQYPGLIAHFQETTGQTFDLSEYAEQAKNPDLAFAIMTIGMHQGIYTGKKLSDYLNSKKTDYKNARKIINGLDHAQTIAGYAAAFEKILKASTISTAVPQNQPADNTPKLPAESSEETPIAQSELDEQPLNPNQPVEVTAPAKENSTSTATQLTIGGIVLPPTIAVVVKSVADLVSQGYISAQQIGEFILNLVKDNMRYVLLLVGAIILLLIAKKTFKQIAFYLQMWFAASKDKNTVEIVKQ